MVSQPFKELRFEDGGGDRVSAIDWPGVQGFKCVGKPSSERQTPRFCQRLHKILAWDAKSSADLNTIAAFFEGPLALSLVFCAGEPDRTIPQAVLTGGSEAGSNGLLVL
jgi:hypothetical protein